MGADGTRKDGPEGSTKVTGIIIRHPPRQLAESRGNEGLFAQNRPHFPDLFHIRLKRKLHRIGQNLTLSPRDSKA
jgi:hypothetical protein